MSSYGRSRSRPDAADGIASIRGLYYSIVSIGPIVLAADVFASLQAKAAQCLLKVWQCATRISLPVSDKDPHPGSRVMEVWMTSRYVDSSETVSIR